MADEIPPTSESPKRTDSSASAFAFVLGFLGTLLLVAGTFIGSAFRGWGDGSGIYTPTFSSTWLSALAVLGILGLYLYAIIKTTRNWIRITTGLAIVLTVPLTLRILSEFVKGTSTSFKLHAYEKEQNRQRAWHAMGHDLTPLLLDYVQKHRDAVRPTGRGEYIEVAGFAEFAAKRNPDWILKGGKLIDPWGGPVEYGMDLNSDGWIQGDERDGYGCWDEHGNKIAVGVHSYGSHDANRPSGWVLDGGVVRNKPSR